MTDRLAAIQERLEAILAARAARETPAPAPVPGPELPPRAGFEALRSIKIGMTPGEVERLAGPPDQVERAGNGWMTWYYASGRSVTFDGRGRARSMTGFAAP